MSNDTGERGPRGDEGRKGDTGQKGDTGAQGQKGDSSDNNAVYKVLEVMGDRMTDIQKNYQVLNECHHTLEVRQVIMETKLNTIYRILTFFISPAAALLLLAQLLTVLGYIK